MGRGGGKGGRGAGGSSQEARPSAYSGGRGRGMSGDGRANSQREIASLKIEALARAFEAEGLGLPEGVRSEAEVSKAGEGGEREQTEGGEDCLQTIFDMEKRVRDSSYFHLGLERSDSPVKTSSHARHTKWVGPDSNLIHRFLSKDCDSIERMKVQTQIGKERCLHCMHGRVHSSKECNNTRSRSHAAASQSHTAATTDSPAGASRSEGPVSPMMAFAQAQYLHNMEALACQSPGIARSTPKRSQPGDVCRLHGDDTVRHWEKHLEPRDAQLLTCLRLDRKGLKAPPVGLTQFRSLASLHLAHNLIVRFPEDVQLPELTELDVSCNRLTDFPVIQAAFPRLEKLNLSRNKISGDFRDLPPLLTEVDMSGNELLSFCCSGLSSLQHLYLHSNRLERIDEIETCHKLRSLFLRDNRLVVVGLPASGTLLKLDCAKNRLQKLPDALPSCKNLQSLWAFQNEIKELPVSIGTMQSLAFLDLRSNLLHNLPKTLPGLATLHTALLGRNLFSEFPLVLCHLPSLRTLDMSQNMLKEVNNDVTSLFQLCSLDLSGNRLTERPAVLDSLGTSCKVSLHDNPLAGRQPDDGHERDGN